MSVRGRLVGTGPLTQQSTLALTTDGRRSPGAWRAALRPVPPAPGLAARHRAAAGRAGTCLRRLNKSALLNPSDCTALTVCGDGEEEEDSQEIHSRSVLSVFLVPAASLLESGYSL